MMRFSGQLQEAIGAKKLDEAAERLAIMPGQMVAVRTKRGVNVIKRGRVTFVDKPTGTIRVEDVESGSTLEIDVDPEKYIVWILPPPNRDVERLKRVSTMYVRGGLRPSAYQGGKWP